MKKKIIVISAVFIISIIIVLSFVVSFINDRKIKERREEIKQWRNIKTHTPIFIQT